MWDQALRRPCKTMHKATVATNRATTIANTNCSSCINNIHLKKRPSTVRGVTTAVCAAALVTCSRVFGAGELVCAVLRSIFTITCVINIIRPGVNVVFCSELRRSPSDSRPYDSVRPETLRFPPIRKYRRSR